MVKLRWRKRTSGSPRQIGKAFFLKPSQQSMKATLPSLRLERKPIEFASITDLNRKMIFDNIANGDIRSDIFKRLDERYPDRFSKNTVYDIIDQLIKSGKLVERFERGGKLRLLYKPAGVA